MVNWTKLEENTGIKVANRELFTQAFTHTSYSNERKGISFDPDNERLEFLGDAVLELTVSEHLYRTNPDMSEGELTRTRALIVCEPTLARFAQELEFAIHIRLGKGEDYMGGRDRPSLLADVFEAFVGALYMDQGLEVVRGFIENKLLYKIDSKWLSNMLDAKSELQEWVQQEHLGALEYKIVEEQGPAHDRYFISEVLLNKDFLGRGSGRSKKEAEQKAAAEALNRFGLGG